MEDETEQNNQEQIIAEEILPANDENDKKVPLQTVIKAEEKPNEAVVPTLLLQSTDELLRTLSMPKVIETTSVVVEQLRTEGTSVDNNDDDEPELPKSTDRITVQA